MTHPFHPLHGREFELLQSRLCRGIERVDYIDADGVVRSLAAAWTSAGAEDPFLIVAAGRSAFRVPDLLALAALLDGLHEDGPIGRSADGDGGTVKNITPHV